MQGTSTSSCPKAAGRDAVLFRWCSELCFAIGFLHSPENHKNPQPYPGVLLALRGMFRDFLALMKLGGHRNTFEEPLCAGL